MADLDVRVLEEIRRIARADLEYAGEVNLPQRLQEDLHLDSMAMIVVAAGLENAFRVRLEEQDAGAIATVGDLVTLVVRRVAEAGR